MAVRCGDWLATGKGRYGVNLLWVLVMSGWLLVPAWLMFVSSITSSNWFGEPPSTADVADARRFAWQALKLLVALPPIGLLLAGLRRNEVLTTLSLVCTGLGVCGAGLVGVYVAKL